MNSLDDLVKSEWKPGTSAGAAARQLCRSLAPDSALKLLLEAMLADANEAAQDRTIILNEIMEFDLNFGKQLKLASFNRINHPFYGAECPSYPDCNGGCGLGCTHEIERLRAFDLPPWVNGRV